MKGEKGIEGAEEKMWNESERGKPRNRERVKKGGN